MANWTCWKRCGYPGAGFLLALGLLLAVEGLLHSDAVMHRFRGVFAVGRAFDKVLYVESHPPGVLLLGNSRMDNAVDPVTLCRRIDSGLMGFNLGLPGASATALRGIVERLDAGGHFGPARIERVVVSLDEGVLQGGDALGYEIFFADRAWWQDDWRRYLRTHIHLWGYADNLKHLREPAKLLQFWQSLVKPLEPVGGGAASRLGYRPGFGGLQDTGQVASQEAGSTRPPDPEVVADFWAIIQLLEKRGVAVAVIFPPLLARPVLYLDPNHSAAAPYLRIRAELAIRGIPMYALAPGETFSPAEFVNAGHLNDRGAQKFSTMLGDALAHGLDGRFMKVTTP
jgi:hypothetical protein